MAELVRAMKAAAEAERERLVAALRKEGEAATLAVRSIGAERAAELRRLADEEIASVRASAKEEIARIRSAVEARLTTRRERLAAEIDAVNAETAENIDRLREGVNGYEQTLEALFAQLRAEEDPGAIGRLAAALPEPPRLPAAPTELFAATPRQPAREEPVAVAEKAADEGMATAPSEPSPEPSATTSAVPTAEPSETTLHVRGLADIGAIAGYKWQLGAVAGVEAAQVTSSRDGELVIHVRHAPDFSIVEALASIPGYATQVMRSEGAEAWATVREAAQDDEEGPSQSDGEAGEAQGTGG